MVIKVSALSQVKTIIILQHFFSRKSYFYEHFQRKNEFYFYIISFKRPYVNFSLTDFKKVASSH